MTTSRIKALGSAALTVLAVAAPFQAWAQQSSRQGEQPEDEEIVVTARMRDEALADVPGTVSVLTAKTLEAAGVERAADFLAMTPGVSLVNAIEVGDTQVNIRGLNSSRDAEQSFAFVLDGILMSNTAAFNREFVDLQQVEVFKGPQGAIYGRNAQAGAILVTTRAPGNELEAQAKASFGSGNNERFAVATIAGPLVRDKLFVRLGADYRKSDGFYRNLYRPENKIDDFEGRNLTARLLWTPSADVKVDLKTRIGRVEGSSITFNAIFALPAFEASGGFEDANAHRFTFVNNLPEHKTQDAFELSGKIDAELGWATLTAWGLYSDIDNRFLADGTSGGFGFFAGEPNCLASAAAIGVGDPVLFPPPSFNSGNPVPFLAAPAVGSFYSAYTPTTCDGYQYQRRSQKDASFEVRLTSPGDRPLRWQAGVYFLDIDRIVGVATALDPTYPVALGGTGGTVIPELISPLTESLAYDRFGSRVYAAFGNVQYDLTEAFELSLALRYDLERRNVDNLVPTPSQQSSRYIIAPYLNPAMIPGIAQLAPDGSIPSRAQSFQQLQPKLSATWKVSDSTTLFANWGVGFKSGGFNNQGAAATVELFINRLNGTSPASAPALRAIGAGFAPVAITDTFKKETSSAAELGFKSRLVGNKVSIEGAAYYTDVRDMQFFEFMAGPFGLLRVVNGIDRVSLWGGELAVRARPADWLSLSLGGNFTRSKIKKMLSRPDAVGNSSPYTPDYNLNASVELRDRIPGTDWRWMARADLARVGPTWFHVIQDQLRPTIFSAFDSTPLVPGGIFSDNSRSRRAPYNTVDVRLGVEIGKLAITGFVENLTNSRHLQEIVPAPEFGGSFSVPPSALRSWGIELSLRY